MREDNYIISRIERVKGYGEKACGWSVVISYPIAMT